MRTSRSCRYAQRLEILRADSGPIAPPAPPTITLRQSTRPASLPRQAALGISGSKLPGLEARFPLVAEATLGRPRYSISILVSSFNSSGSRDRPAPSPTLPSAPDNPRWPAVGFAARPLQTGPVIRLLDPALREHRGRRYHFERGIERIRVQTRQPTAHSPPGNPIGRAGSPGGFQLRSAERQFHASSTQQPPRSTRVSPARSPLGSTATWLLFT